MMLVALGMVLAGTLKGASGIGFPSIATPILAMVLGVRTAAVVLAVPSFLVNAAQWTRVRLPSAQLRPAAGYLVGTAVGLAVGTRVLLFAENLPLGIVMGTIGLVYVLFRFWRPDFRLQWLGTQSGGVLLGLLGGGLKGATNVSGPLMVMYLQNRSLSKDGFAGLSAFILQFTGGLRLVLLMAAGAIDLATGLYSVALLFPSLVGLALGEVLRWRLSEELFSRLTTGILGVLSLVLIINDLLG